MHDRFVVDAALVALLPPEAATQCGHGHPRTDLFGPRSRAPRRVMMTAIDAGSFPDGKDCAVFACRRCDHRTGWVYSSRTEARRGVPCPACNVGDR